MADTLKDFLIALKFNIDADGMRRFSESIVASHRVVKDFAIGVAGMAVAVEEAIRRTTRQFENLYYLSQQGNVAVANVSAWQFAFKQVGLSAGDLNQTILTVAKNFRDNPGLRGLSQGLVPGAQDATQVVQGLAQQYRALMDRFGESGPQLDIASVGLRRMAERLGVSAESLYRLARNWRELQRGLQDQRAIVEAFGLDQKRASENAVAAERSWNIVWETLKVALDSLIVETFPFVQQILRDFANWFRTEGAASIRSWAASIKEFVDNKDNINAIEAAFKRVGGAIVDGVTALTNWIGKEDGVRKLGSSIQTIALDVERIVDAGKWIVGNWEKAAELLGAVVSNPRAGQPELSDEAQRRLRERGVRVPGPETLTPGSPFPTGSFSPLEVLRNLGGTIQDIGRWIRGTKQTPWVKVETDQPLSVQLASSVSGSFGFADTLLRGLVDAVGSAVGEHAVTSDHVGVAGGGRMPGRVRRGGAGGGAVGIPNIEGMTPAEKNFLGLVEKYESHGRNIMNFIGDRTHTAQGFFQITNTNWHRLAPRLGIHATSAMGASLEDQAKVALALLRESGPGNWMNYNPQLRGAVGRGEKAIFDVPRLGSDRQRTSMNVDSDHNTNINIYGASNPQGTADAVTTVQRRESALHTRNLRTALA